MTTHEDISNAHWRAVGTVLIAIVAASVVLGIGVAIGYNLAVAT